MFSDLMSAGAKALGGARFSLVNVLPGTLLVAILLVATTSGAYGSGPASVASVIDAAHKLDAGGAVLLVFALFVAGVVIQPFQVALVQLLEGYWGGGVFAGSVGTVACEFHRRRLITAAVRSQAVAVVPISRRPAAVTDYARDVRTAARIAGRAEARLNRYPVDPDRVMPTMLGNVLRGAEDMAGGRYNLDAMTVYPRMYPSISKPLLASLTRQLDVIAVTASMCVSFTVGALATAPLLARFDPWSFVPVAGALLALISYRGAVRAAEGHGTLLATAFDLHRFDLVRSLHYRLPRTVEEEQDFNGELTRFLQQRETAHEDFADYPYDHSIYGEHRVPAEASDPPEQSDGPPADGEHDDHTEVTPEDDARSDPQSRPDPAH